jgi:hypothetical protein
VQLPQVQSVAEPKKFSWCGESGKWTEVISASTSDAPQSPQEQRQRPSQIVHESAIASPEGNHITITMERLSTAALDMLQSSSAAQAGR